MLHLFLHVVWDVIHRISAFRRASEVSAMGIMLSLTVKGWVVYTKSIFDVETWSSFQWILWKVSEWKRSALNLIDFRWRALGWI